jgi:Fe-S-cluster containining protein
MSDSDEVYGTADDSPVGRRDFERAIRALNASDVEMRDALLKLAAHVVSLTDELTRRLDHVEPQPAPPGTQAHQSGHTVEETVAAYLPQTLDQIRARDTLANQRVSIDASGTSKYDAEGAAPPCAELMPLCKARCCTLSFALSTEDLDEGVIRWDYGQPYLIRQRASDGYCVHNHPGTQGCTVHEYRPRVCRAYDCRKDERIWLDYEQRIPAPLGHREALEDIEKVELVDLLERVKARRTADHFEAAAVAQSHSDAQPVLGPRPAPKKPPIDS